MVKFIPIEPEDISDFRESHRGRVSYPLLKSFLETGLPLVQLDRTGMQQSVQSLYSSLSAYVRSHNLPVKIFQRKGQIFLMRLDTDSEGNTLLSADEAMAGEFGTDREDNTPVADARPITPDEVANRFKEAMDPTR